MESKIKLMLAMALTLATLFTACKKEVIKGPQGDPGANGTGGNSSINSTALFVIDSTAWQYNTVSLEWEITSTQNIITQNVVDKGLVKLYMELNGYWTEMPYAYGDEVTEFAYKLNQIRITRGSSHGEMPIRPITTNYRLVVLFESAKKSTLPKMQNQKTLTTNN